MRPGLGEAAELISPAVRLWREESEDPSHQIKKGLFSKELGELPLFVFVPSVSVVASPHLSPG